MEKISVVISAWNEEQNIERCLKSLSWVDEIIVIDNQSSDSTAQIAKKYTTKVTKRTNNSMLNVNKNFGFTKAKGDWILSLDADEMVTEELAHEIRQAIENKMVNGFWLPRKNIIFGKWIQHGLWWPDKQLRLFRKGKGVFPERHVHEYLQVDGPVGELKTPYIHYNYQTISQFLRKMDTLYTESEVERLVNTQYQIFWYDAIRFPISDFLKIFFAQKAYKDGLHGLVLSLLQSFYSFIVFAKLWEKKGFNECSLSLELVSQELKKTNKEINYWMLSSKIAESRSALNKIWYKIHRRLFQIFLFNK